MVNYVLKEQQRERFVSTDLCDLRNDVAFVEADRDFKIPTIDFGTQT